MRKVYWLLLLLLLFPIKASAIHEVIDSRCTNELKMSLKDDAKNVAYRLTKVENKDNVTYSVLFYNVTDDIYLEDGNGNKYGSKIENLKPGTSIMVNIYASNKNYCEGYKAGYKLIKVPYYNKYYKHELCKGYENYSLCKEDSNINMTEKEFEKAMNDYINSLKPKQDEQQQQEEQTNKFDFIEFINDYWIYILLPLVVILVTIVVVMLINKRKNRGIL